MFKAGDIAYAAFLVPLFADGYTPVEGLVNADFNKTLLRNGALTAVTATVTEVALGYYSVNFTPPTAGDWTLIISNDANAWRKEYHFHVTVLGYDDEHPHSL